MVVKKTDVPAPKKPEAFEELELEASKELKKPEAAPRQAKAKASEAYNPCPVCGTHLDADVCAVDGHRRGEKGAEPFKDPDYGF